MPAAQVGLGDPGLGKGKAQVGIVEIGKLPQHMVLRIGTGPVVIAVGDIQGIDPLPAGIEAGHQDGAPAAPEEDVGLGGRAIGIETMGVIVGRQQGQIAHHGARHIGHDFIAGGAVEAMQHAVVAAHVDARRAGLVAQPEVPVWHRFETVRVETIGRAHIHGRGIDEVAQQEAAVAEVAPVAQLLAPVAAEIGHAVAAQGIGIAVFVSAQPGLQDPARRHGVPGEADPATAVRVPGIDVAARGGLELQLRRRAPGGQGDELGLGGNAHRQRGNVDGKQVACPVGGVETRLVDEGAGGIERETGGRRRARALALADVVQDHVEAGHQLLGIAGGGIHAASRDGRVPQIVHPVVAPGEGTVSQGGPVPAAAVLAVGVIGIEYPVAGQAHAHREGHHVLPHGGVVLGVPEDIVVVHVPVVVIIDLGERREGGDVIGQIRAQIMGPVVEGDVAQELVLWIPVGGTAVIADHAERRVSLIVQGEGMRFVILIADVVGVVVGKYISIVPCSIGEGDMEVLAAGVLGAVPRLAAPRHLGVGAVDTAFLVFAAGTVIGGLQGRAGISLGDGFKPVEKGRAVGAGELAHDANVREQVERLVANAHFRAEAREGERGCRLGQQAARAVIGIPVGEVLDFLGIGAV